MRIKYIVETMDLNAKVLKVMIVFKRIPTQEQLEQFRRYKEEQGQKTKIIPKQMAPGIHMIQMLLNDEEEVELNFNKVKIILPVEEVNKLELKMGMVVELNMPESKEDILKVEE